MGLLDEAIPELEASVSRDFSNARFEAYLGYAYAAAGRTADAQRVLARLEELRRWQDVSSFGLALIYDALGEKEPALLAWNARFRTGRSNSRKWNSTRSRASSPTLPLCGGDDRGQSLNLGAPSGEFESVVVKKRVNYPASNEGALPLRLWQAQTRSVPLHREI